MTTESKWEDRFRILNRDCRSIAIQLQEAQSTIKDLSDKLHIKQCAIDRWKEANTKIEYHTAEIKPEDQKSLQWFYDRIGKTIYRGWDFYEKECIHHTHTPVVEIFLFGESHAFYVHMYSEICHYRDTPYLALLPQYSESTCIEMTNTMMNRFMKARETTRKSLKKKK
jgi:hypothetical protein